MKFHGAKLLLIHSGRLLTCLRDDIPTIPFPGHWDLPGGGREGDETPVECALRELQEEFGLGLSNSRLIEYEFPSAQFRGNSSWLFYGELIEAEISTIRFGDEGQEWRMMPIVEFLKHPKAVPDFKSRINAVLPASSAKSHHP